MADNNLKYHQKEVGAPYLGELLKTINKWTVLWVLLSVITTATYGYFFEYEMLSGKGFWEISGILMAELILFALIWGFILLFIHDVKQKDDPVQRLFPVAIWGRKILIKMGPLLRQYLFLNDKEETPYNRITRKWVYETSKGVKNTIGFGTQVDMDQVGSMVILPATFTNKTSKSGEEVGHTYKRVIGEHTSAEPVTLNHFVHIGGMSYGALNYRALSALNKGAGMAGILHNTGEGGLAPCHEHGGDLIFQIGTAKYGVRTKDGHLDEEKLKEIATHDNVKMFEIKLAQGAKPGKGGMLLKEKISDEIARIRKIPKGQDAYSPARHEEFSDVNGLFDFIERIRTLTKKPVGIKMVIGHTSEIESIAEKMEKEPGKGPDFICIDGGDGGTGASPLVLSSYAGLPLKQALAVAQWALKSHNVRDKVTLFGSGKISTPIDIAVTMALGADAVYIARGFMLSLGCIQALDCHTNRCPSGIATQDPNLSKALNIDAAAKRVANYTQTLYNETQMLAETCGYKTPTQITPDDIMVVTSPGHLDYLSELQGYSAYEASLERQKANKMGLTVGEMKMKEYQRNSAS